MLKPLVFLFSLLFYTPVYGAALCVGMFADAKTEVVDLTLKDPSKMTLEEKLMNPYNDQVLTLMKSQKSPGYKPIWIEINGRNGSVKLKLGRGLGSGRFTLVFELLGMVNEKGEIMQFEKKKVVRLSNHLITVGLLRNYVEGVRNLKKYSHGKTQKHLKELLVIDFENSNPDMYLILNYLDILGSSADIAHGRVAGLDPKTESEKIIQMARDIYDVGESNDFVGSNITLVRLSSGETVYLPIDVLMVEPWQRYSDDPKVRRATPFDYARDLPWRLRKKMKNVIYEERRSAYGIQR